MYLERLNIKAVDKDRIPPNDNKAADIFARIGYRLEEALADLVDNSIDANAKNVLIRFQRYSEGVHSVMVVDDGKGMDDARLLEAMRYSPRHLGS